MSSAYVLSEAAEADLRCIAEYTLDTWGVEQCLAYMAELEKKAEALACGRCVYKDLGSVLPGLRVAMSGSHHIFCLVRPDRPALVLAILHERMDLMVRLRDRLRV